MTWSRLSEATGGTAHAIGLFGTSGGRALELLHSMLVHQFLVGRHSLLGLIGVDAPSKALLSNKTVDVQSG